MSDTSDGFPQETKQTAFLWIAERPLCRVKEAWVGHICCSQLKQCLRHNVASQTLEVGPFQAEEGAQETGVMNKIETSPGTALENDFRGAQQVEGACAVPLESANATRERGHLPVLSRETADNKTRLAVLACLQNYDNRGFSSHNIGL